MVWTQVVEVQWTRFLKNSLGQGEMCAGARTCTCGGRGCFVGGTQACVALVWNADLPGCDVQVVATTKNLLHLPCRHFTHYREYLWVWERPTCFGVYVGWGWGVCGGTRLFSAWNVDLDWSDLHPFCATARCYGCEGQFFEGAVVGKGV